MNKKKVGDGWSLARAALLLGILGGFGLPLALLMGMPSFLETRVVALVQAELDRQFRANVRFDGVSASMFRHFPDVTVRVSGLRVEGREPFEGVELARATDVLVTVDVMSVLTGSEITVKRFRVTAADVHVIFDEEGRTNLDILPTSEEETSSEGSYALSLKQYVLEDLWITYEDRQAGRVVTLKGLNHWGSAKYTASAIDLQTRTDVAGLGFTEGGVDLLRDVVVGWDLNASIDNQTGTVRLADNQLALNELVVSATGSVTPGDEALDLDLTFEALETRFRSLMSLVPTVYSRRFDDLVTGGTLALSGQVKGALPYAADTLPAFGVDLKIEDGSFRYPELPGVSGVRVNARVSHQGGSPDAVVLDVKDFRASVDGQPVQGSLRLTHAQTDPDLALKLVGKLDLDKLTRALPTLGVTARGNMDVDVDVAGRLSAFEAQKVDEVRAEGSVHMAGVVYEDPEQPVPVFVDKLTLRLDPRRVDLAELELRLGQSDVSGTMQVDNLLSYALGDAVLVGRADLRSRLMDLDELASADEEEAESGESSLYVIPDDLDLDVGLSLARVRYGGKDYHDIRGRVATKGGALKMNDVRMKALDGHVTLNGTYQAESEQAADVEVRLDVRDLGIAGVVDAYETLRKLVPVARLAPGKVNTELGLTLRLGPDLSPDLASLFSDGRLQLHGVTLKPEVMKKVATTLNAPAFEQIDLQNTALVYQIANGRLHVRPTPFRLGGVQATLTGHTGTLDQTLDLRIDSDVPVGKLGTAIPGLTVGNVPLVVRIGGTFTHPDVRVDLGGAVDSIIADVKDQLADKAEAALDDALAAAREQGEALLAEAQKRADALLAAAAEQARNIRKAARQEGQKLVNQAKNPVAKKAAEVAANKLTQEADKAASKVEREARNAADKLMAEARAQQEKLLEEAGGQARSRLR